MMECAEVFDRAEAVVFDFEGTLVDFQWQLAPAVGEGLAALAAAGLDASALGPNPGYAQLFNGALDMADQGNGRPGAQAVRTALDEVYDRYDADALTRWALREGAADAVRALGARPLALSLVSNVGEKALRACLEKLGLAGGITVVISRDRVSRLKPHPEGLLAAARQMGVNPGQCVKVGDSLNDVGAARAAGMMSCYISGGENQPRQMRENPPDCSIVSLKDLI